MKQLITSILTCAVGLTAMAQTMPERLKACVDSFYAADPKTNGVLVYVESPDKHLGWSYAAGYADKTPNIPLEADQPVLTASNTKTYVAATILKLVEHGKFQLQQPIDQLISTVTRDKMVKDGYKTTEITVRQLLSHISGITDYVDEDYKTFVNTHRKYEWTRDEQIDRAMKKKAFAAPGDSFRYADINYLLLTEIIEKSTGKPFYKAMRSLLDYKHNNLRQTWFTKLEDAPKNMKPMAHQYWDHYPWDSYDLDPSWDLYGGGGIVATAHDMGHFFQLLFTGELVTDKKTLAEMYTDVPSKSATNYCLGVRKLSVAGETAYYHGGFWGTDVAYFPRLNTSVAIVILERSEREKSAVLCARLADIIRSSN
jgi:D-alanyl-D-alanine carboxypeptidase